MPTPGLTADQLAAFRRDGYLVLPGFYDAATCESLVARAKALVEAFEPGEVASIFTTNEQTRVTDDYFLASGDDVRFFFEAEAFRPDGGLRQDKALSINKIGHALHDRDPLFARASRDPRLAAICADLGMADPRLMQSMYIFKNPFIGGEVGCHQDGTFLYTDPLTVTGFWVALQDATTENGCLWALPGGHLGPLRRRFRRDGAGGVTFDELDDTPFPPVESAAPWVPLEAPQGTLVLLHALLPHWSCANRSARSRHAYAVHIVDGAAAYPADNWLQRATPARGFS
ncbi:MAG TPA: phytanoyl-CoA dioxygenase family protein [Alphaproteobacteria bacterium]|nr:phytanoyl-CoA dioxygenase family protein [Alphaproteobacteria bacterium]